MSAQSDPIKRRTLYLKIVKMCVFGGSSTNNVTTFLCLFLCLKMFVILRGDVIIGWNLKYVQTNIFKGEKSKLKKWRNIYKSRFGQNIDNTITQNNLLVDGKIL